jgi:hypothetical protein
MKKDVVEGVCIAHDSLQKCIQVSVLQKKKKKKKSPLADLGADFVMIMHF